MQMAENCYLPVLLHQHYRGVTSNEAEEALASCTIELQVSCDLPH